MNPSVPPQTEGLVPETVTPDGVGGESFTEILIVVSGEVQPLTV